MSTHKHHIVPKHAGGTNDPANLVELTIEDHAIAHRVLFKMYGRWQDELAWLALSGLIGMEEVWRRAVIAANTGKGPNRGSFKKGQIALNKGRKGLQGKNSGTITSERAKAQKTRLGIPTSALQKQRASEVHKGRPKPQPDVTCPHCGKSGRLSVMHRWHFDRCKKVCA